MPKSHSRLLIAFCPLAAFAAIGVLFEMAPAANVSWTGAADANWSNNGNWDVGKPITHDSITFGNTSQPGVRGDFSSYPDSDPLAFDQPPLDLESLTFAAGAPSYSVELYSSAATSLLYHASLLLDGSGVANQSGL